MRALSVLLMLLIAWLPLAQAASWCCASVAEPPADASVEADGMPCHAGATEAPAPSPDSQVCLDHCAAVGSQVAASSPVEHWQALINRPICRPHLSPELRAAHARPLLRPPALPLL